MPRPGWLGHVGARWPLPAAPRAEIDLDTRPTPLSSCLYRRERRALRRFVRCILCNRLTPRKSHTASSTHWSEARREHAGQAALRHDAGLLGLRGEAGEAAVGKHGYDQLHRRHRSGRAQPVRLFTPPLQPPRRGVEKRRGAGARLRRRRLGGARLRWQPLLQ